MYKCKELDTSYDTEQELFKALKDNKADIIASKKASIYKSCEKGSGVKSNRLDASKINGATKEQFSDDNYHYIAVNTTNVLDSHKDLHVNGIWNKTAKEQNRKNALVDTHYMSLKTTIARRKDVEMFVAEIPFASIGKSYEGNTQALIYKIRKDKIREEYKEFLEDGSDIEASVRMQYVNIKLAINSEDEEYKEEKLVYDKNISNVANKEDFETIKHFWVVSEAKNNGESSLVLQGSNHATGIVQENKIEPSNDTQEEKEAVKANTSANSLLI